MDQKQFTSAIAQIAEEKGIPKEKVFETIEMALAAAYKKDYGERGQIVKAELDPSTGEVKFKQIKIVVEESMLKKEEEEGEEIPIVETEEVEGEKKIKFNPEKHIMIEEALKINPDAKIGDEIIFNLETHADYGRIAAQTAKQVIIQRLREAEREIVFEEYKNKEGSITSGIVQRIEGQNIYIDIGKTTGILPPEEQIPGERLRLGERIKIYILSVQQNPRGAALVISRSHPQMIKKLFEIEVPEIGVGSVEIKAIAREAGYRTKIAVASNEEGLDPIGSCVGQRGTRVSAVINEIGGEKIDIIEWNSNVSKFISNSISPAKVIEIEIDEKTKSAKILVPDDQLSLAIGKGGQNVRLAAKLTGWKIDIRSAGKPEETATSATEEEGEEENKTIKKQKENK